MTIEIMDLRCFIGIPIAGASRFTGYQWLPFHSYQMPTVMASLFTNGSMVYPINVPLFTVFHSDLHKYKRSKYTNMYPII